MEISPTSTAGCIRESSCNGSGDAPRRRHEDRWIIEHRHALALLGLDLNTNCAPAHFKCGEVKTHTQDLPRIRKAKRQQMAGAKND